MKLTDLRTIHVVVDSDSEDVVGLAVDRAEADKRIAQLKLSREGEWEVVELRVDREGR